MSQVGARVVGAGCEVSLPAFAWGRGLYAHPSSARTCPLVCVEYKWLDDKGALVSEREIPGVRERSSQYGLGQSGTAAAGGSP